jgi:hypothetical protein
MMIQNNSEFLTNPIEIKTQIVQNLINAKSKIFISTPLLNFHTNIYHQHHQQEQNNNHYSFLTFIHEICEKNSNLMINILVSESGLTDKPELPTKCFVNIIKKFGPSIKDQLLAYTPTLQKLLYEELRNNNNNSDGTSDEMDKIQIRDFIRYIDQNIYEYNFSYVMIDDRVLLFGDISRILFSSVPEIVDNWMLITKPNQNFIKFCNYNWEYKGLLPKNIWEKEFIVLDHSEQNKQQSNNVEKRIKTNDHESDNNMTIIDEYGNEEIISNNLTSIIKPSTKKIIEEELSYTQIKHYDIIGNGEFEHDLICTWIEEAKSYIQIETPILISFHQTKNQIANYISRRLITARKNSELQIYDPFRCLICVNSEIYGHSQETDFEDRKYIHEKIKYTLDHIMSEIAKAGYDSYEFKDRIRVISSLKRSDRHFNFNQSIIVQDGKNCLLTSSSLCDRSLVNQNLEIGLIIQNNSKFICYIQNKIQKLRSFQSTHNRGDDNFNFDNYFQEILDHSDQKKSWTNPSSRREEFLKTDYILKILIGYLYFC